jgi:hypothetical protein
MHGPEKGIDKADVAASECVAQPFADRLRPSAVRDGVADKKKLAAGFDNHVGIIAERKADCQGSDPTVYYTSDEGRISSTAGKVAC